jgi:hypothetical protein
VICGGGGGGGMCRNARGLQIDGKLRAPERVLGNDVDDFSPAAAAAETQERCIIRRAHNQQRARKFLRISSTHSAILNTRGVKKQRQEGASRGCRGRPRA